MGFFKTSGAGKDALIQNTKDKLDRIADNYCGEITNGKNKVLQPRYIKNKTTKKYECVLDFPAMAAACTSLRMPEVIVKKHSCSMPIRAVHLLYEEAINSQKFILGKRSKTCKNKIGRCAEQNAGNTLLKKDSSIKSLDEIYFSHAIRPRTRQIFEYCDNCKAIFPTLK